MAVREEVLNVRLSDVLKSKGLNARAEEIVHHRGDRKLPDVIVDVEGVRVIIEARSQKANLIEDTVKRVESGICSVAIGLLYPKGLSNESDIESAIRTAKFDASVAYFDREGLQTRHEGAIDVDELVSRIHAVRQIQVSEDLTAYHVFAVRAAIDNVVKDGLQQLDITGSTSLASALSKRLGLSGQPGSKGLSDELLRIAIFVIFDAMIFQGLVAERYPGRIQNVNATTKKGRHSFLLRNWTEILDIDYEPIFRIAHDILEVMPNSIFWNRHPITNSGSSSTIGTATTNALNSPITSSSRTASAITLESNRSVLTKSV